MASKQNRDTASAKRIAALMESANVDADELAKRMKINRSTVYHWRSGARVPSRELQPKLAKQLGVTVAEINGWAA